MRGEIIKVIQTTYDGYYIVKTSKMMYVYEGKALLPRKAEDWIKTHDVETVGAFWHDIQ